MRLSTTTLGCPEWELTTVLERLKEYGYDGVDFRGLRGELAIWKLPEFSTDLERTAGLIRDSGLAVSCISSSVRLTPTDPEQKAAIDEELDRTAEICLALGCADIRVFGGALKAADEATEADRPKVIEIAAERAIELAERARAIGPVELLIETHDDWTNSEHLAALLDRIKRVDVGCLWDVRHPYWVHGETPETTWERLGTWVRATHWKDGKKEADGERLVPVGEGILPLGDFHEMLKSTDYDGWYTLEWEKKWHPEIEEPEVAFPQFVKFMRGLEA